ncbi:MAG: hypothetical protein KC731_33895, partial [Myxococcales bacterium]|nr:hypothetical protein [Myxococcales bacterium]
MILCDRVSGGRGPRVFGLSLSLPPGLHAVVGEASDGTLAFAELVAGRVAPLVGRLTIGGVPPSTSPSLRAGLGLALEEPTLPDLGRVSDLLDAVAPRWSDGELATLVDALRPRRLGSLPLPDARRLALCLALRHDAPRAVVLHEPFGILPDALL